MQGRRLQYPAKVIAITATWKNRYGARSHNPYDL